MRSAKLSEVKKALATRAVDRVRRMSYIVGVFRIERPMVSPRYLRDNARGQALFSSDPKKSPGWVGTGVELALLSMR